MSAPPSTRHRLVEDNVALLRQGVAVLESLPDGLYAAEEARVSSSGIGGHVRHCIDYYRCLLRGLDSGRVDYDRRERDERIERDRDHAVASMRALIEDLRGLAETDLEPALQVKMDCGLEDEAHAPWSRSSVPRELHALISHTVHHYALVAVVLRLQGVEPPAEFGVAPSTLRHWEERQACAR